ncbi:efflux RND transporter periplasmic adaptor subunit [Aneurinibacillus aneurinilyticus]|uniref:HlyD family efflux transporter periplasmic adaptor subunit n=1 Tax=Aneurinibacillus aneurinilyticus TaxID=1391 RepID=A0A848D3A6_ANEAE|nr:HlyD family efflux transporter periplasmic adaptor subunit [Aneurinibacillus aneurinilyticus]NMF00487.1 HlyD family efflux transporter periplasmic adaptor subunit [Aneurinibacillus aneurinilyticus]
MRRLGINIIVMLCLLAVIAGGGYYVTQQVNYVKTDNARVLADMETVSAPENGRLDTWSAQTGEQVKAGTLLGMEKAIAAKPHDELKAPIEGTVLKTNALPGQMVAQKQPLAMIADMKKMYILAYIDETQIGDVGVGNTVDVYLDAYSGTKFSGEVSEIGYEAGNFLQGGQFSHQKGGTPSKEIKRVPVKITVDDFYGNYVALGMNATVKIHK